jgi:hypothetical protein
MSPLEARLPEEVSSKAGRRLVWRRAARSIIGPFAIAVGIAVAAPTVINRLGGKAEGGLGAVVAFMGGANLVQEGLDLASAVLFVLAGAKLLGPRPDEARGEFAAGLVVLSALWVSLLRSTLYRSLLPWSFRFAALLGLLSLLAAAFVLFRLFGEDGAPATD